MSSLLEASIFKIGNEEERTITGPVLIPDYRDQQLASISVSEIRKACHLFTSTLQAGFMHDDFTKDLEIVANWVSLVDIEIPKEDGVQTEDNGELVNKYPLGTWFITMRILDDKIWEGVKDGTYKGFSLGAVANVQYEDTKKVSEE